MVGNLNNREAWIDNAKMFAMFCVIVGHCSSMIASNMTSKEAFNLFIVAFNMPLFVTLSGYTSVRPLSRINTWMDLHHYLLKLAKRIAIPNLNYTALTMWAVYSVQGRYIKALLLMAVFLVILAVSLYIYLKDNSFAKLLCYLFVFASFVHTPIWFLPYILLTMIIWGLSHVISVRFCRSSLTVQVFIFLCLSCLCWWLPFFSMIEFAPVFLIGFLLAHFSVFEKLKHTYALSFLLLIAGFYCFVQYHSYDNQFYKTSILDLIYNDQFYIWLYRELASILLSIGFMMFFYRGLQRKTNFSYWGTLTLAIYPIHSIFISIMRELFNPLHIENFVLNTLIVTTLALLLLFITMITIFTIFKNPFLKFALLGIK